MATSYQETFNGLQVRWDFNREVEQISRETLLAVGKEESDVYTSAYFIYPTEEGAYRYKASGYRRGNAIYLVYKKEDEPECFEENDWEMDPGTLEIKFKDTALEKLDAVFWKNEKSKRSAKVKNPRYLVQSNESPLGKKRKMVSRTAWQRNQAQFKSALFQGHDSCVVTGEKQANVLQAAHIIPVSKGGADNANNGILLRADIHLLFDRGLISINPNDGTIELNPLISEYVGSDKFVKKLNIDVFEKISKALKIMGKI